MDTTVTPMRDFLATTPLFEDIERRALERMASRATVLEIQRGTTLFRQGDPCAGLHIIVSGQVKLVLNTGGGGEKVVALLAPGASFGEAALLLRQPHLTSAESVTEATLARISCDDIREEVRRNPGFAAQMIRQLCRRLYQRTLELQGYMTRSGTQRVIDYLLNNRPEGCGGCDLTVTLPVKKGLIASRLNLTQAHFSRVLHGLVDQGLIEVRGRNVLIYDIGRLQAHGSK